MQAADRFSLRLPFLIISLEIGTSAATARFIIIHTQGMPMAEISFSSKIRIMGSNPYVRVSARQAAILKPGWKKPLPVLVQVNGMPDTPWRINMMPVGDGSFYLYLHGNVRKASRTKVGDMVKVAVSFDSEYRNGPMRKMPAWFSSALKKNPTARKNWELLIPSRKKEILRYLSALKSEEARERNLKRALEALSGSPLRFMARSWNNGK